MSFLRIKLPFDTVFKLVLYNSFKKRVDFIQKNIFENDELICLNEKGKQISYKSYLNICATKGLTVGQIKKIEKRWLGIRVIGRNYPNETLKLILDVLGWYLLGTKDYSAEPHIKKYIKLEKLVSKNKKLKDKIKYYSLKESVLYYKPYTVRSKKGYLIFFINNRFEEFVRNRILNIIKLIQSKKRIYHENDIYNIFKTLVNKLYECEQVKNECLEVVKQIEYCKTEIKLIKKLLKNEYGIYKDTKRKDIDQIEYMVKMSNRLKLLNDEIKYLEQTIDDLYNKYCIETEFIYCGF